MTLTLVYKNNLFKDLPQFVTVKHVHLTMEDDSAHNYVQFVGFNRRMLREDFDMCLAERVFEPTRGTTLCLNEPQNLLNPAA